MNKITYIFGAGASVGALPIVKDIPSRISQLITKLGSSTLHLPNTPNSFKDLPPDKTYLDYQNELIDSLSWLKENCELHYSVDTFAKKLKIKDQNDDLKKLKIALSVFFVLEQLINKPDSRYDSFLASIIERLHVFPDHVKVLSWNYDYQFELTYSTYTDNPHIYKNQVNLGVFSKNWANDFFDHTGFTLFKLNGTTGFKYWKVDSSYNFIEFYNGTLDKDILKEVVQNYAKVMYSNVLIPSLSFAWERDLSEEKVFERAIKSTEDTRVLVVVGYSFPFFNRDVDRQILDNMNKLKKVYVQDPYHAEDIIERIKAALGDERIEHNKIVFEPINDKEQFYLPHEL
jgi:hypothetical protein